MISVLIVDDSKSMRSILAKYLREYDIDILEAGDGVQGVKVFKESNPTIVLMDIDMPNLDGISALKQIMAINGSALVCMLTAHKGMASVKEAVSAGAKAYIVKPFEQERVLKTLENMIGIRFTKRVSEEESKIEKVIKPKKMVKVIIAEDNDFVQSVYKKYLGGYNILLFFIETGEEAVNAYLEQKPDIVFMDINMPILDGFEATKMIIEKDSEAKICIVSAQSKKKTSSLATRAGAISYLTKPFKVEDLINVIEENVHIKVSKKH